MSNLSKTVLEGQILGNPNIHGLIYTYTYLDDVSGLGRYGWIDE